MDFSAEMERTFACWTMPYWWSAAQTGYRDTPELYGVFYPCTRFRFTFLLIKWISRQPIETNWWVRLKSSFMTVVSIFLWMIQMATMISLPCAAKAWWTKYLESGLVSGTRSGRELKAGLYFLLFRFCTEITGDRGTVKESAITRDASGVYQRIRSKNI